MTSSEFLAMRERVVAAIMSNPVAGPESQAMLDRINDPGQDCTFEELGFDSLARMEFCIFLETEFGIAVTSGDVEAAAAINAMAVRLVETGRGR
ncbi:phosphopantetheine-binding protein [Emcibacter sp. SYSU 3D8]|uniref:phosphopantetheine-binding protein n=1 Tax=Emcibacter sp. SYSU 3D8 TaxID=3133969 RepID=UPI0031FE442E